MLPWCESHRPLNLVDVCGNDDVRRALLSFKTIASLPHLILHGPPGSGKTSSILALGRSFFGKKSVATMVLELNAGDVRGVETMRNQIQFFTKCSAVTESVHDGIGIKLVILDEADGLTHHAQCALRHLIETSGERVRFCLCCNYINKLSSGLRSRCTSFRFSGLGKDQLYRTVQTVAAKEGILLSCRDTDAIVSASSGDARQAINLLQGHALGRQSQRKEDHAHPVYELCGLPSPSQVALLFDSLLTERFSVAHELLADLVHEQQYSLAQVLAPLADKIMACDNTDECEDVRSERAGGVISALADVELCLSQGGSESLAVGAVVGAFHSNSNSVAL